MKLTACCWRSEARPLSKYVQHGARRLRGTIADPHNRRQHDDTNLTANNIVLNEMFFSPIKREIVIVAEGDLPSLTANAMTAFASGAFEDTTFEPLITTEEMVEAMKKAQQIAGRYSTPNQDEIDRMLLDE